MLEMGLTANGEGIQKIIDFKAKAGDILDDKVQSLLLTFPPICNPNLHNSEPPAVHTANAHEPRAVRGPGAAFGGETAAPTGTVPAFSLPIGDIIRGCGTKKTRRLPPLGLCLTTSHTES